MDWYKFVMLVASVTVVAFSPWLVAKAIRRMERHRVVEIPVLVLAMLYMTVNEFRPGFLRQQAAPIRWLVGAVLLLFVADVFGLSRWLFRARRTPDGKE